MRLILGSTGLAPWDGVLLGIEGSQAVILKLECASQSPGMLLKHILLEWGLRLCISHQFPGDMMLFIVRSLLRASILDLKRELWEQKGLKTMYGLDVQIVQMETCIPRSRPIL